MTEGSHTLDAFQHEAINFITRSGGRCILADPVGARKTGTTLAYLRDSDAEKILVVAPKSVHGHWRREAGRFFPEVAVYMGANTASSRRKAIEGVGFVLEPAIYVTTYESMKGDELLILAAKFDTVIFDEGHRLKGRRTLVALSANAVTKDAAHIIIATGTPVVNHPHELWQYLHMLDRDNYRSFWSWAEEHFHISYDYFNGRGGMVTKTVLGFKTGHEALVRAECAGSLIQREIEDLFPGKAWVLEPEHIAIDVELSPAERKAYDKLVKFGWADVGAETIQVSNPLAESTRLRQLASDWGTLDKNAPHDSSKIVAASELIADISRHETVVVFCQFKATVYRLADRLDRAGVRVNVFTGDESVAAHEAVLRRFGNGGVDVVVGTLDSLAEGVDGLQRRGSTIVMLDRAWTAKGNEQAIGRRRRSGQEKRVTVYHVYAVDTIDATVVDACLRKVNFIQVLKDKPLKSVLYGRVK